MRWFVDGNKWLNVWPDLGSGPSLKKFPGDLRIVSHLINILEENSSWRKNDSIKRIMAYHEASMKYSKATKNKFLKSCLEVWSQTLQWKTNNHQVTHSNPVSSCWYLKAKFHISD